VEQSQDEQPIKFEPDKNLGRFVMAQTGRELMLWDGSCIVHETFTERKILDLKVEHPQSEIIAHPECEPSVLRHADFIGSTTALLNYAKTSPIQTFIVATEPGILHQMQKQNATKSYIPAPSGTCACNECPFMRLNTLEKLYLSMKNRSPEIILPEETRQAALAPIQRMLEMS